MKYLLPLLALLYAYNATAAVESTGGRAEPKHHEAPPRAVMIVPREHYDALKCKQHKERVGNKLCEWSECRNSEYLWTDDLMRCTEEAGTETAAPEDAESDTHMATTVIDGRELILPTPHADAEE